ncbi:MAG: hypothetical protein ACTSRS_17125 [Candidatus Helarchaeota archaeon]
MKEILISVLASEIMEIAKDPIKVTVDDDADFIQAMAAADRIFAKLSEGKFPIEQLSSLLQLVFDPRSWNFYEDMGIECRTPDGRWIPLRADPSLNLPPGTDIKLTPDSGC